MSVDQSNIVDFASIDKDTGNVWLTVSDHLPWDIEQGAHLELLQEKLNAYLRFVESGELLRRYPQAEGRKVVFDVVGKFPPNHQAELFFNQCREAVGNAGFGFQHRIMPSS